MTKPKVDLSYALAFLREEGYAPAADAFEVRLQFLETIKGLVFTYVDAEETITRLQALFKEAEK